MDHCSWTSSSSFSWTTDSEDSAPTWTVEPNRSQFDGLNPFNAIKPHDEAANKNLIIRWVILIEYVSNWSVRYSLQKRTAVGVLFTKKALLE